MIRHLIKSRVQAHLRHEHSGKTTLIPEYTDKRQKKATVTTIPNLKAESKKLADTHRVAKYRKPHFMENPVIETKGGERVARMLETHHATKKTQPKKWGPGSELKFQRKGIDLYNRNGILVRETPNSWFVQPRRNAKGETEILKLDKKKDSVLSTRQYKAREKAKVSTDTTRTADGDRTMARNNLTSEELNRRKAVVEQRLGYTEDKIVEHPSFIGPAIKICSSLAIENGISAAMLAKPTATLWHQAADGNYQEILFHYAQGAILAWRRVLANPLHDGKGKRLPDADQTENNVKEFKDVLDNKRHSSYTHFVMEKEGKGAAVRWLQEWRNQRDMMHGQDINDMAEDPEARRLLSDRSTQPMQLKYTLHVNQETLADDTLKVMNKLDSFEREIIKIKYGFGDYGKLPVGDGKTADDRGRQLVNNETIADVLNKKGLLNGKLKWTRNTIGEKINETIAKLASDATKEELSYHMDDAMGRPVWKSFTGAMVAMLTDSLSIEEILEKSEDEPLTRIPKEFHPEGLFKAGEIEYQVVHEGDEAVLVKGGTFDELFEIADNAAREQLLVKAAEDELLAALEKTE